MHEIYTGEMPWCVACLAGHPERCEDLMWSDTYGLYACGNPDAQPQPTS